MTGEFLEFLIEAKRRTYAAQGDDASVAPALPGARQLEHRRGVYLYRDLYFGLRRFAGQETVDHAGRPVWSMAYAGGIVRRDLAIDEVRSVCAFLREALRQVAPDRPYRGPATCGKPPYAYACSAKGDLEMFQGAEEISDGLGVVYRLSFAGGRVDG